MNSGYTQDVKNALTSPVREIGASVTFYREKEDGTGVETIGTYTHNDRLISFNIERMGETGKFFGFGVCQRINIHLIDKNRELEMAAGDGIRVLYSLPAAQQTVDVHPVFTISQVRRDELTNELSITGYDYLYKASSVTASTILSDNINTCANMANAIWQKLWVTNSDVTTVTTPLWIGDDIQTFKSEIIEPNLDGTETLREVLDDIAEATMTVYYVNADNCLVFKQIDRDGQPVLTIGKADYFSLDSGKNKRLQTIASVTTLGDNISASTTQIGSTQYLRDNCIFELRSDVGDWLDDALVFMGNLTINMFTCDWRGNMFLEPADKIGLVTKDNETTTTFVFDDVIDYNGVFHQKTQWDYTDVEELETAPSSLGEALQETYARVDKVNNEIELVVSDITNMGGSLDQMEGDINTMYNSISSIQLNTEGIVATVNQSLEDMTNRVNAAMTSDEISILIQQELESGVDKVTTSTGFTFDENGLTIDKTGSEMSTQITEDGMSIFKSGNEVLTVDNIGVKARNLHAATFLIIGTNSRFEDYENGTRTGCFWIGN